MDPYRASSLEQRLCEIETRKRQELDEAVHRRLNAAYATLVHTILESGTLRRICLLKRLESLIHRYSFDPQRAKEIRQLADITQADLAVQLGFNKSLQQRLSGYESGRVPPPQKRGFGKAYLLWLKQQGYNPYNL